MSSPRQSEGNWVTPPPGKERRVFAIATSTISRNDPSDNSMLVAERCFRGASTKQSLVRRVHSAIPSQPGRKLARDHQCNVSERSLLARSMARSSKKSCYDRERIRYNRRIGCFKSRGVGRFSPDRSSLFKPARKPSHRGDRKSEYIETGGQLSGRWLLV